MQSTVVMSSSMSNPQLQDAFLLLHPSRDSYWLVGIIVTLVGTTVGVVGYMLQKLSHSKRATDRPYWTDSRWMMGFAIMSVGHVMCWMVQGLTSQSILSCFNCWNIIVVFVLAPLAFGEHVSQGALTGAALLIAGCMWIVCSGQKEVPAETVASLKSNWKNVQFLLYVACTMVVLATVAVRIALRRSVVSALGSSSIDFVIISAVCGSYAVVCSKTTSLLALNTAETGENQIFRWEFFVVFVVTFIFGVTQLHCLNEALRIGEAIVVLPTYNATAMITQMLAAGTFFSEFDSFGVRSMASFWCGVFIIVCGIATLSHYANHNGTREEEERRPLSKHMSDNQPAKVEHLVNNFKV